MLFVHSFGDSQSLISRLIKLLYMQIKAAQIFSPCPPCSMCWPSQVPYDHPFFWARQNIFKPFPHLDPLAWVQWWWKFSCLFRPFKNSNIGLNLIRAAKTNCWRCVRGLEFKGPLDGVTGDKRLTWVTYCMRCLKTHKPKTCSS